MRIVYCTNSVSQIGGIEHVTVAKANALANIEGNHVWIAVTEYSGDPWGVDKKVHLVNLGIHYYEGTTQDSRVIQLAKILRRQLQHKKRLTALFDEISPDIIISTGTFEKYLLPFCGSRSSKLIREIHTASNCRIFYAKNLYEKVIARIGNFLDYRLLIRRFDKIVVLTEEDRRRCWKNRKNVIVIPNPCTFVSPSISSLDQKIVISAGKLSKEKNFDALIRSWKHVHSRHPDWRLFILGSGEESRALLSLINDLSLQDSVLLMGNVRNVTSFLENASVFAFSSLTEGFALVLIEAMTAGLPVVTYACPCGPKDLITNGKDGYLIPVGDEQALAEKISFLIENKDVRKAMGNEAHKKAQLYTIETIIEKWVALFIELIGR